MHSSAGTFKYSLGPNQMHKTAHIPRESIMTSGALHLLGAGPASKKLVQFICSNFADFLFQHSSMKAENPFNGQCLSAFKQQ